MKEKYLFMLMGIFLISCGAKSTPISKEVSNNIIEIKDTTGMSVAYFASGCFWCVEAVFESVKGIGEAVSGYSGGRKEDATYDRVSAGVTDHAESVKVFYDTKIIDYKTLLNVFFDSQDPTTLNQQGPDRGRQYRSTVFYQNDVEKTLAQLAIDNINQSKKYKNPVSTTLERFSSFYDAEDYHQDFERKNPNQGYVKAVSIPRLNKFKKKHPELLKPGH